MHKNIIKKDGVLSKEEIDFLIPKLASKLGQVNGTESVGYQIHLNKIPN